MATGLNTAEATLGFWTIWFPMIFVVAFGLPGIIMIPFGLFQIIFLLIGIPFILISAGALFLVLRTLIRYAKIKNKGKMIQATVYGYMNDNLLINNQPAQIVKLLVDTPNGPRFILYSLGNTMKPYAVNSTINIMVYKNYFMIPKNKEVGEW